MKTPLTDDQKSNYVDAPNHCPYCGSDDIEAGGSEMDGELMVVPVKCNSCEADWEDVYRLSSIYERD